MKIYTFSLKKGAQIQRKSITKNTFLSFVVLLTFSLSASAQIIIKVGDINIDSGEEVCVPVLIGSTAPLGTPNILSITNVLFSWNPLSLIGGHVQNINPNLPELGIDDFTMSFDTIRMDWVYLECNEANSNSPGVYFPNVNEFFHAFDICFDAAIGDFGDCLPVEIVNTDINPPILHRSFTFIQGVGCPSYGLQYESGCVSVNDSPSFTSDIITNLNVSLTPNPFINETAVQVSGIEFKNAQLSLFNTLGILLREEAFNGNEFLLKRGDLRAGIYLFEIKLDGRKGFVGKMMVE